MPDEPAVGAPLRTSNPDSALPSKPVRVGPIPSAVTALLRRVHALERSPFVGDRKAAFGLMRALLGGARRSGYSAPQLAECLGISVSTLRTRAYNDGWISETTFAEIADLSLEDLRRWRRLGRLPHRSTSEAGEVCYLASELVRALALPPVRRSPSSRP